MANYAIGDLQGCLDSLHELLRAFDFKPGQDTLWFVGDLVNRGPKSLASLRTLKSMGDSVRCVLGNHDLHLLALYAGCGRKHKSDTIAEIVQAPDATELIDWLRAQPLVLELPHQQEEKRRLMVHAGLLPEWSFDQALTYSDEVQRVLTEPDWQDFMTVLYGNEPAQWHDDLQGYDRLRCIVNVCTRMRMLQEDGSMDLKFKLEPELAPPHLKPWCDIARKRKEGQIVFGHWSMLNRVTNRAGYCLDTGCVWGGQLTALRLEDEHIFQVPAVEISCTNP